MTALDPQDGSKLWTSEQWSNDATRCVWNTRIVEYQIAGAQARPAADRSLALLRPSGLGVFRVAISIDFGSPMNRLQLLRTVRRWQIYSRYIMGNRSSEYVQPAYRFDTMTIAAIATPTR